MSCNELNLSLYIIIIIIIIIKIMSLFSEDNILSTSRYVTKVKVLLYIKHLKKTKHKNSR